MTCLIDRILDGAGMKSDASGDVFCNKVRLENGWNSKQMITEGETAILLETPRRAFRNQEKSKQRSAIGRYTDFQENNIPWNVWEKVPNFSL